MHRLSVSKGEIGGRTRSAATAFAQYAVGSRAAPLPYERNDLDMKKYNTPKLDLIAVSDEDVITASPGTEAPRVEIDGGIWDLEIG